jgi:hypothetical protein
MTRRAEIMRALTLPPADFVRSVFKPGVKAALPTAPRHSDVPRLRGAEIAAAYHNQRVAGDFYEFLPVGLSRVLFGLFDLAGRRQDTRAILIAAQDSVRALAPKVFAGKVWARSATPMPVIRRHCSGTIPELHNSMQGVCRSASSPTPLTVPRPVPWVRGRRFCWCPRGIVEAEHNDQELGLEGAKKSFQAASALTAQDLCLAILLSAEQFMEAPPAHNDVTALVLLRKSRLLRRNRQLKIKH